MNMSEECDKLEAVDIKKAEHRENETKKLVYVQLPKEKTQEFKVLTNSTSNPVSVANCSSKFVPLTSKISGSVNISGGGFKDSPKTTFTLTKNAKFSAGSNIKFSSIPLSSLSSNNRASILKNKVTISPIAPSTISPSSNSIKVSINGPKNVSGSQSIFNSATTHNPPNIIVCQASTLMVNQGKNNIVSFSKLRNAAQTSFAQKSGNQVLINPKLVPGADGAKLVSPKLLPMKLNRKNAFPLAKLLQSEVEGSAGVKRDVTGAVKRDVPAWMNHCSSPPPLILQSGSNVKRMAVRKGANAINIYTGKGSDDRSGINIYSVSRSEALRKPNSLNFTITNGQIQAPTNLTSSLNSNNKKYGDVSDPLRHIPTVDLSGEDSSEEECEALNSTAATTFFRKASTQSPSKNRNETTNSSEVLNEDKIVVSEAEVGSESDLRNSPPTNDPSSTLISPEKSQILEISCSNSNSNDSQKFIDVSPNSKHAENLDKEVSENFFKNSSPLKYFSTSSESSFTPFKSNKDEAKKDTDDLKGETAVEGNLEDKPLQPMLEWNEDTGLLLGCDLKFKVNEFDAVELVEDEEFNKAKRQLNDLEQPIKIDSKDLQSEVSGIDSQHSVTDSESANSECAPNVPVTVTPPLTPKKASIHTHHSRKPNLLKKNQGDGDGANVENRRNTKNQYDICCCNNCGCYGLSSEFGRYNSNSFCTITCYEDFSAKEAAWNKEKLKLEKRAKSRRTKIVENENQNVKCVQLNSSNEPKLLPEDSDERLHSEVSGTTGNEQEFCPPWRDPANKGFSWSKYLEYCSKVDKVCIAAPRKLWGDLAFSGNLCKAGMKLEVIDPRYQSLFCVATMIEVIGCRLRVHFDGYSDMFDFWCNTNSPLLFPVGWCEKNGRKLETPPGIFNFSWKAYLTHCEAQPAPKQAFSARNTSVPVNNFRVGMKLEAEKRNTNGWICVATVADSVDGRILVHYDGWDKIFDSWFEVNSPFIHPVGWCASNGVRLYPPNNYPNPDSFNWHEYLQDTNSNAVPSRAFKTKPHSEFKVGMKLEVVDKRNPMLIRVATISDIQNRKLLIHFDGWPEMFDIWIDDDSPDMFPPGWCNQTKHPLQPPLTPEENAEDVDSGLGCGTQGCKGFGHIKGPIYSTHHTAFGCPYSLQNLSKDWEALLPNRFESSSKKLPKSKNHTGAENFVNLDSSKPVPLEMDSVEEDERKKRVRKRRKFFDEISPSVSAINSSKPKISRNNSDEMNASIKNMEIAKNQRVSCAPNESSQSSSIAVVNLEMENGDSTSSNLISEPNVDTVVHQSIFNPGYHPAPPPPLPPLLKDRHKHIISSLNVAPGDQPESWSSRLVRDAIAKIPGCGPWAETFQGQEIDGESLLMLTQNDLIDHLGLKLGPAIKVMAVILALKNNL